MRRVSFISFATLALLVSLAIPAHAVAGDLAWSNEEGGQSGSTAYDIAISPDGNTVVSAGWLGPSGSPDDWFVAAYDAATGARSWFHRLDDRNHGMDQASAVEVDPTRSRAYVTGSWKPGNRYTIRTIAFDLATGHRVWTSTFDSGSSDYPAAMTVSTEGVFVVGGSGDASLVLAYARKSGRRLWRATMPGGTWYDAVAVGTRVFVAGNDGASKVAARVAAYGAGAGRRLYAKTYVGPFAAAFGTDIAVTQDGLRVVIVATEYAGDRVMIAGFSGVDGSNVWHRVPRTQSGGFDESGAIAVSPDNATVYLTVESDDTFAVPSYETIAYAAGDGTKTWGPIRENGFQQAGSPGDIIVSADGSTVYVTGGGRNGSGYWGPLTFAYDAANGGSLWDHWTAGTPSIPWGAGSIVAAPDNSRVYVAGKTNSGALTEAYLTG